MNARWTVTRMSASRMSSINDPSGGADESLFAMTRGKADLFPLERMFVVRRLRRREQGGGFVLLYESTESHSATQGKQGKSRVRMLDDGGRTWSIGSARAMRTGAGQ